MTIAVEVEVEEKALDRVVMMMVVQRFVKRVGEVNIAMDYEKERDREQYSP